MRFGGTKIPAILHAQLAAFRCRKRLPPGSLRKPMNSGTDSQDYFQQKARKHGPIYKVWWNNKVMICVDGQLRGNELLKRHDNRFKVPLVDYASIFPKGAMRGMDGKPHAHYRKILSGGIQAMNSRQNTEFARSLFKSCFDELVRQGPVVTAEVVANLMTKLADDLVFAAFLGVEPDTDEMMQLKTAYDALIVHDRKRRITPEYKERYQQFRQLVCQLPAYLRPEEQARESDLSHLKSHDTWDETVLGNLIFSIESARLEFAVMWQWCISELADHPELVAQIFATEPSDRRELVRATAKEVLRLHSGGFMIREVMRDFTFEGFTFPRKTYVRWCNWEGHNTSENFENPTEFRPHRFIAQKVSPSIYRPFGVGHHACIAAIWSSTLLETMIDEVANNLQLSREKPAPQENFAVVFVPGKDSSIRVEKRLPV